MFSREQRLQSSKDILFTIRRGNRSRYGSLSCYFISKPGNLGKIAIIVDTKVSKKAVVRNLIKRRIRSICKNIGLPEGWLVLRTQPQVATMEFSQLEKEVRQCLQKVSSSH